MDTMKTCTKCGIEKPLGDFRSGRNSCKQCKKEYNRTRYAEVYSKDEELQKQSNQRSRAWAKANPERKKEGEKKWLEDNVDRNKETKRSYYENVERPNREANAEEVKARKKIYNDANREKNAITGKAWREANPEKMRDSGKSWREDNPEKVRLSRVMSESKRRAIKTGATATLTSGEWDEIWTDHKGLCFYCGDLAYVMEHIVPLCPRTEGDMQGSHTKENVVPSCQPCNSSKSNEDPLTWYFRRIWQGSVGYSVKEGEDYGLQT